MAFNRTTFNLTPDDKAKIAAIRAAHGLPTDTAAIRWALDFADADIALHGIGGAAQDAERAYRRLGEVFKANNLTLLDMAGKRAEFKALADALDKVFAVAATPDTDVHIIPDALSDAPTALCGKSADLCGDVVDADEAVDMAVDGLCEGCHEAR